MKLPIRFVVLLSSWLVVACHDGGPATDVAPSVRTHPTTKVAGAAQMCREHGVPEALCTRCNPALVPVFKARGDWCQEHRFPESFCPICNPNAKFPDVGVPGPATPRHNRASELDEWDCVDELVDEEAWSQEVVV
jgi:hypothetical protein